jgi:SPP1 gp7 family putative phage head morphogenesis protein
MSFFKNLFQPIINATKSGLQKRYLQKSLDFVSGLEWEEKNPDKLLDDKSKTLELYDIMMQDDRISSIVELKIRLALSVNGEFVAASEEEKDVEINEWVSTMMYGMITRWWDVLYNMLEGGIVHGFKCGEKIFDMEEGKIILRNIKFMHSMFFDFGYSKYGDLDKLYIGKEYGDTQVVRGSLIDRKFVIFVYPYLKNGSYYGDSDLREVYPQYRTKYQVFRFRNIYLQNYGQPIPIVAYDSARVDDDEKADMEAFLKNLQDNMYLMIPGIRSRDKEGEYNEKLLKKFEIELLENKHQSGTDQYEKTIDQLDRQISRKLLVPDKMGFTVDSTGAKAQSEVFFDVLKMVIKDLHGRLEDTVNEIIEQMVDLNYPGVEEYPTWQFEKIDEKIEGEMLKVLLDKGVIDKREAWIRPWTGVPELSKEEQEEIDEAKEEDEKKQAEQFALGNVPFSGKPPVPGKPNPAKNAARGEKDKFKTPESNIKNIERIYDEAEADFIRDFALIHIQLSESLIKQVRNKKIIENNDLAAMKKLRINKTELKRLMSLYYAKLYIEGKESGIVEIKDRIPPIPATLKRDYLDGNDWLDREWIDSYLDKYGDLGILTAADKEYLSKIRDRAFFITGDIENRMLKDVETTIISGLDNGLPANTIISQISNKLTEDRRRFATTIARTNASDAFNSGRMNLFTSENIAPLIEAYQYNAILDNVTTLYCEQHDGQILYPNDPAFGVSNPPNHFNCRSLLLPIMVAENEQKGSPYYNFKETEETWGTGVSKNYRLPAEGFGGIPRNQGGWG